MDRHILWNIHKDAPVHTDPVEPDHNKILITPVCQKIHRNIIDTSAVQICLSCNLFLLKAGKIRAGHQHIFHRPRRG